MNRNYRLKSPIFKSTEGGRKQSLRVLGQKLYGSKQFNKIAPQMSLPLMLKTDDIEKQTMEPEVSISGILLMIVFYLSFIYMYTTSWYKGKLTWTLKDNYGITLSEAFVNTEKLGATFLLILMTALYIGLLIEKGFVSEHSSTLKISLITVCFVLLTSFLLMFTIGPSRKNKYQMGFHVALAVIALIFMLYGSFVFTYLYNQIYYPEGLIEDLTNTTYALTASIGCLIISFILVLILKKEYKRVSQAIGIFEIITILIFGIIIGIVSFLPKLVDYESLCVSLGYVNSE